MHDQPHKANLWYNFHHHRQGATYYSEADGFNRVAPNRDIYLKMFGEGILEGLAKNGLERKDVWVTFKGLNPNNVANELAVSKLKYFDLWMFHAGMGASESLVPFLENGMIRNWGVSNSVCGDYIINGKKCFAEQNQLRFDIQNKEIPYMYYSPFKVVIDQIESFAESDFKLFLGSFEKWKSLLDKYLKYVVKKYILINDKNVLMVGSRSGNTLENTIKNFYDNARQPLTAAEELEVETFLREIKLM